MKRKSFEREECPLARSLEAVGDAWSVLIVRQAFAGDRRFGEFEKSLGVAKNILTVRLRKLVSLGILEQVPGEGSGYLEYAGAERRSPAPRQKVPGEGSGYLEYALTEKGRGLYLVLMAIRQWGEGCGGDNPYVLVDKRDGKPVKPLAFHAQDGRELSPDDMELVPAASRPVRRK